MIKEIFYDFGGYNISMFHFINKIGNIGYLPYILNAISAIFQIWSFAIYYTIVCIFYGIKVIYAQQSEKLALYNRIFDRLFAIGLCYALFGFVYSCLKFTYNLQRPYCSLPKDYFVTILDISAQRCMSSFPSSHFGLSVMISYLLWSYLNRVCKAIAIILTIFVGFSRITLAMHYPSDIFYSFFIALLVAKSGEVAFNIFKQYKIFKLVRSFLYKKVFSS